MQIAADLHMSEEDILDWPLERYSRWLAFYKQRSEDQKRMARMRSMSSGNVR